MPLVCGVIGLGHGSVVRHSLAFVRSHAVVIVEGNGIAGGHVHPHVVGELAGLAIGGLGRIDAAVLVDLGVALDRVAGIHGHGGLLGPLLQLGVVDLLTVLAGDRAGVVAGSVGLEHGLAVQIQLADDGVCGERILQLGLLSAVGQDRLQSAAVRGLRQGGRAAVRQGHVGLDIGLVGHGPVTGHIDAIALLNQGDVAVPLRVLVLQRHHSAGDGGVVGVLQGHRDPVAQVDSGAFLVSGGLPVLGSIGCEGDGFEGTGNFDNLIGVGPGAIAVLDRFPSLLHSVAGLVQGHSSSRIRGGHHNFKRVAQEVGRGSGLGLDVDGQVPAGHGVAALRPAAGDCHILGRHRKLAIFNRDISRCPALEGVRISTLCYGRTLLVCAIYGHLGADRIFESQGHHSAGRSNSIPLIRYGIGLYGHFLGDVDAQSGKSIMCRFAESNVVCWIICRRNRNYITWSCSIITCQSNLRNRVCSDTDGIWCCPTPVCLRPKGTIAYYRILRAVNPDLL